MSQPENAPTLPAFIRDRAERFPHTPLVVLDDARLTYAEADAQSADLARGLLAIGVGKGTRVGVLHPNGPDWLLAWLAAGRIGALTVPVNTFSRPRELGFVLRHGDVQVLLTATRFLSNPYLERLEEVAPELRGQSEPPLSSLSLPYLRSVYAWGETDRDWATPAGSIQAAASAIDPSHLLAAEACVSPADPLAVVYSSGSTADPKGAVHSHGALLRQAANVNSLRDLVAGDRVYSPMPFFWVGGLVFTLLCSMEVGATVLCEQVFEPERTLDLIEGERATIVAGWPHFATAMAAHPSFATRDLSAVRGGNLYPLLPEENRPADAALRPNSLGMTETCGPHTMGRMEEELPERLRGSFGTSLPGVEHKVVDPDTGAELPAGEEGEICVRGGSLMLGLYKVERDHVFDADGWYHTGDAGHFDAEGHCFFAGRLGEMIKTGGANVTPSEVEAVLQAFQEVSEAYVIGIPDAERGQQVAAVLVFEGAPIAAEQVRLRVREELAPYKAPKQVFAFEKQELPFLDSGKLDRRRLEALLVARLAQGR